MELRLLLELADIERWRAPTRVRHEQPTISGRPEKPALWQPHQRMISAYRCTTTASTGENVHAAEISSTRARPRNAIYD
jgi:hypothetical protein